MRPQYSIHLLTGIALVCGAALTSPSLKAAENSVPSPYGISSKMDRDYKAQKGLIHVMIKGEDEEERTDNMSLILTTLGKRLNAFWKDAEGSIVLLLDGDEVDYFARKNYTKYKKIVDDAAKLAENKKLSIRICGAHVKSHGMAAEDFHGFVKIVPNAMAEIMKLQSEGYAYSYWH